MLHLLPTYAKPIRYHLRMHTCIYNSVPRLYQQVSNYHDIELKKDKIQRYQLGTISQQSTVQQLSTYLMYVLLLQQTSFPAESLELLLSLRFPGTRGWKINGVGTNACLGCVEVTGELSRYKLDIFLRGKPLRLSYLSYIQHGSFVT